LPQSPSGNSVAKIRLYHRACPFVSPLHAH
jgi:hypothetical protein